MDGYLALVLIVALITTGVTIASVMESINLKFFRSLSQLDAIDDELKRLHGDTSDYSSVPDWMRAEINRLNTALIGYKEDKS